MKTSKIFVALVLTSLAAEAGAQTSALQSTADDAGRGGFQLAQAGAGQSEQGMRQGGPSDNGNGERPHGPPPEAITACKGKISGAACTFIGRQNEKLTGTCFSPPPDGQREHPMACRPDHNTQGGGRPPQR
jgi:hypothetical protein